MSIMAKKYGTFLVEIVYRGAMLSNGVIWGTK
jgi:hypothetical protein